MNKLPYKYFLLISFFLIFCSYSYSQDETDFTGKFEIDEINIKFSGHKSYSQSDIKNLLATKSGDYFDQDNYLKDAERIKKFYFDNGFFDAEVDTNLIFNKKDKEVIQNFIIKQNARYKYYKIQYLGLDSIDNSVKEKIFDPEEILISEGRYYSKDSIKLEAARVLNLLFNNGYATALSENPEIIKFETNKHSLENKVNINFIYKPRLRYEFGKTTITIKSPKYKLSIEDIRRELTYSENQIYNKEEVVNSEMNIGRIAILDNPRIVLDRIDSINNKIYLAINAVVGDKYGLTPEIYGYYFQNVFYLGTGLSFSDKYFLGSDQTLTTSAKFYFHSLQDNRLEFLNSIFKPILFNNRNISGTWNIGIQYRLNQQANVTQVNNFFGIAYDLPHYTYINRITSNWNLINTRLIVNDVYTSDTIFVPKFAINYFSSVLGVTAIHNTVTDIQFPFRGNYQSYDFQESGLLGNIVNKIFNTQTSSFFKFTDFNAFYFNLTSTEQKISSVIATKISSGILIEYGSNQFTFQDQKINADRVPDDQKYLCGGSSSIRGWGANQLGIVVNKGVGGNFIMENTIEHRLRPFLNSANVYLRDLGFASFIDFGNVWSEIGKFKINEIALAAGGGIRYYTIIGAIRFDVGLKIYDPQPGPVGGSNWLFGSGCNYSDKYHFQLGLGNTF